MSKISDFTNMEEQPKVGEIVQVLSKGGYVPPNYLSLQGNIVSQSTYSELFSKIGLLKDGIGNFTESSLGFYNIRTVVYGDLGFVVTADSDSFGTSSSLYKSANGSNWQFLSAGWPSNPSYVTSSLYANGLYLFATLAGKLATSTDLVTVTQQNIGSAMAVYAMTYGNGLYVLAGESGQLRTSTNGAAWTARTSGTTSTIYSLAYGNGVYVYGGNAGMIATSTDAITWTARTSGTTTTINKMIYANGIFLASYSAYYGAWTSTDGITWSRIDNNAVYGITFYANGMYCLDNGIIYTSTDCIKWKPAEGGGRFNTLDTTYGNGVIVSVGQSGSLDRSFEFSYNTSTEFALPTIARDSDQNYNFYVKAL